MTSFVVQDHILAKLLGYCNFLCIKRQTNYLKCIYFILFMFINQYAPLHYEH